MTEEMKNIFARYNEPLIFEDLCRCRYGFSCEDGPVIGGCGLFKNRKDDWSVLLKKIMNCVNPNKKVGAMYFSLIRTALLAAEERELSFEEIKPKLDLRLGSLLVAIKKLDEKLSQL